MERRGAGAGPRLLVPEEQGLDGRVFEGVNVAGKEDEGLVAAFFACVPHAAPEAAVLLTVIVDSSTHAVALVAPGAHGDIGRGLSFLPTVFPPRNPAPVRRPATEIATIVRGALLIAGEDTVR